MVLRTSWFVRAVAAAVAGGSLIVAAPAHVGAAVTGPCQRYVATDGSDDNPGTRAAPYRSLGRLVAALDPGDVGCVRAGGVYWTANSRTDGGYGIVSGGGTPDAPVTITAEQPGTVVKGQIWIRPEAHDVTFTGLRFLGNYLPSGDGYPIKATELIVHGDRVSLVGNEIRNPYGICVGAGRADQVDADVNDVAEGLRVVDNDIHGCGMAADLTWEAADSGAHGVYLENTLDAVVTGNTIHDNRYRGLQLWPRNDGAEISHNLFVRNATHVNIGSSLSCTGTCRTTYGQFKAENTDVHDNIFIGRVTDWRPSQNPSQVYGFFPEGSPTYGNDVHDNCFAPGDAATTGDGYARHDNEIAAPVFVDGVLRSDSPCVGKGPASIQPTGPTTYVVDATVTGPGGGTKGQGLVNTTGVGQTARVSRAPRESVSFTVTIENAGTAVDEWSIADQAVGTRGFRSMWTMNGADVTDLVRSGNLQRHEVDPGGTLRLRLTVTVTRRASGTAVWLLHGVHNPLADQVRDVVGIRVTRR